MSEELKLCPFCGHEPQSKESQAYGALIYCPNCEATTRLMSQESAAIAMWNNGFIYPRDEDLPYRFFQALDDIAGCISYGLSGYSPV